MRKTKLMEKFKNKKFNLVSVQRKYSVLNPFTGEMIMSDKDIEDIPVSVLKSKVLKIIHTASKLVYKNFNTSEVLTLNDKTAILA